MVCGLSHGDVVCPGGMCSVPWLMPGGLPQGEGCGPFHHPSPGGLSRGWSVTGGSVLWSVLRMGGKVDLPPAMFGNFGGHFGVLRLGSDSGFLIKLMPMMCGIQNQQKGW